MKISPPKKPKILPWKRLATLLLSNSVLGFLLGLSVGAEALNLALSLTLGWAGILALIWSQPKDTTLTSPKTTAVDWLVAFCWALGLTIFFLLILASRSTSVPIPGSVWAWVWAWIGTALVLASPFTCAWASVSVFEELLELFSKFHSFVMVTLTYGLGLGLGWLVYQIFPIFQ